MGNGLRLFADDWVEVAKSQTFGIHYIVMRLHRLGSFSCSAIASAARRVGFLVQGPCHSGVTYTSRRHLQ